LVQVPKSIKILAPLVDYYAELHNAPGAEDVELVKPEGETWESFQKTWQQSVAYEPKTKKFLQKAKKLEERKSAGTSSSGSDTNEARPQSSERLDRS
jgi:hypothetical protein